MYSIKAVAQATGLTVETLRAWERRYGVVVPGRDSGGRRVYGAPDVLRLRRLREATERGHSIGRLAALTDDALAGLLEEPADRRGRATASAFVGRMIAAAQQFRSAECEQVLTLAIAVLPTPQLVSDVLRPLLHEVGDRWHRGDFAISQERLVSSVVRRHVGLMLDAYDRNAGGAPVVFATLPGERHELGLLAAAMVCAGRGFKVHYLGPDLPAVEIARYAREVGAVVVALSLVMNDEPAQVAAQLHELVHRLPEAVEVWLGGAAATLQLREALPGRCAVLSGNAELEQRLGMLAA
jgi:DNA-binding transcriptional MerR regulator/methylmalonyl-CoA mutase cobalamin-binding subunit